jgi:IclR family acetate operon transcriptional repressor
MPSGESSYFNRTTDRAMRILELLAGAGSQSLSEIARAVGASKSSVYPIVRTLVSSGFVEADEGEGYRLTQRTSALARPVDRGATLVESFFEAVRFSKLANFETLTLGVVSGRSAVVAAEHLPDAHSVRLSVPVGTQLPLHATATGKALMSHWSSDAVHITLGSQQLQRFTSRTITDLASLLADLEKVHQSGIAESWGELDPGTASAAIAIDSGSGNPRAALGVIVPLHRAEPAYWTQTKNRLRDLARDLSAMRST